MPGSLALALKAEALLGLQLVTRHRAPRLAAVLGLALVAVAAASPSAGIGSRAVLLSASTLAGVGASRLLARGPALAAARMAAGDWWVVPVGRSLGALSAVGPYALGLAAVVTAPHGEAGIWRVASVTGGYAVTLIACTMALTPDLGASLAATLAFFAVWLGGVTPSAVSAALAPWPLVRWCAGWAWSLLPLSWRALRWMAGGSASDPLLLAAWAAAGIVLAARGIAVPSGERVSARRVP